MSQSTPPSQPPAEPSGPPAGGAPAPQPVAGNPYAQQPTAGNPFAGGQPGFASGQPGFAPAPPPAPRPGNVALGIVAAVVAAVVTAAVYGTIIGKTEYEIGYAAVGVGFLIGFAAGKLGGGNPALPIVSAVLSLGAVYAGQLVGFAVFGADETGIPVMTFLTEHFGLLTDAWQEEADVMTYLFLAIGAAAAFSGAKKAAG
ncbi:hypothetical protein [Streptomyces sp. CRN 30]|uniref:hypothetical protein n=1 Tax=Streptomyces sp. CRN 30 TaxID=3075613 RepID=UPI002A81F34A|nr:hypothetical protein [Streptomyces sp. CRN 30]